MGSGLRVVREIAGEGAGRSRRWLLGSGLPAQRSGGLGGQVPQGSFRRPGVRRVSAASRPGTRGAARPAVRSARSGGASCLRKAAAYFAKGGAEVTPGVGDHITARSTAARPVLMCQRGRSTRGSGYHEPAGRVSATTTRRRRLTLFIRTEPGASDGTLRVPAHHRGPAAAGARARGPRGGAHPPVRSQGPPGRTAPPKGPGATASGRRAPGLAPRPGQAGLPPPTGPGEQVGGRHPPVSAPGEGPDLPGDRCRLLHQESSRVRDWGDSMRHRVRYARRSIWRPAGARRGGGRRSTPPQAAAPRSTSAQLARHLKGYDTRPSVGRTGVRWDSAWAEVGGYDPQGTRGSIRWCIPQEARPSGILPPRSSWNTRSETTPPRPGAQDAGRGRTRFCKQ